MKDNNRYAIWWKSTLTNKVGRGEPIFSWRKALDIAKRENCLLLYINHIPVFESCPRNLKLDIKSIEEQINEEFNK